ncbi:hypothetical protein JCM17846_11290 [Iodidimonas nitroreducens]|uniref:Uncharacterized protein n=1 Tax=Iodidimonas nitroreducens TaxID=1236968 RepID=A0A5A7N614_9PROT|nr:hypothetical protein [Iodidimonas nitroreducens]GER03447.1 hypothetical protein JCM17846_11290 [Iodidimonas nitroreducens]
MKKPRRRRKTAKAPDEAADAGASNEADKPVKAKAPRHRAPAKSATQKPTKADGDAKAEAEAQAAPEAQAPQTPPEAQTPQTPPKTQPEVQPSPEAQPAPEKPVAPAPDVLERQIVTPDGVKEEKLEEKGEADSSKRKRGWWQRALGR